MRRMRARASRMQKGASLLQKEGVSHALRNPLAFTSRRFRMQKEAFSHAEGSPWRAQTSLRACTKKLSRIQKEALAFAENPRASTRKPHVCRREALRMQKE